MLDEAGMGRMNGGGGSGFRNV